MIRSMTGFGRAFGSEGNIKFIVEIRGVNHRYLEINIRSPRDMNFLDNKITEYVKNKVVRGKIEINIKTEIAKINEKENEKSQTQYDIIVNHDLIDSYIKSLRIVKQKYDLKDDVSIKSISELDNAIIIDKKERNVDELFYILLKALKPAIEEFIATRETEGVQLRNDIVKKLSQMQIELDEIKKIAPILPTEYKKELKERIEKLTENNGIDQERLAQEVAYFADKHAVDEEIVRLESHFNNFNQVLQKGGRIGRKLDFMCQEINREANTIGSKANNLSITNCVIEMKSLLEKIREQVQNIE